MFTVIILLLEAARPETVASGQEPYAREELTSNSMNSEWLCLSN